MVTLLLLFQKDKKMIEKILDYLLQSGTQEYGISDPVFEATYRLIREMYGDDSANYYYDLLEADEFGTLYFRNQSVTISEIIEQLKART